MSTMFELRAQRLNSEKPGRPSPERQSLEAEGRNFCLP